MTARNARRSAAAKEKAAEWQRNYRETDRYKNYIAKYRKRTRTRRLEQQRAASVRYRQRYKTKVSELNRKLAAQRRDRLADDYVKRLLYNRIRSLGLRLEFRHISDQLLDAKRAQLKLLRILKEAT
jgi:hypothetical protein